MSNNSSVAALGVRTRLLTPGFDADVTWERVSGFTPVQEIFLVDDPTVVQQLEGTGFADIEPLPWDYNGDGVNDVPENLAEIVADESLLTKTSRADCDWCSWNATSLGDIDGDGFDDLLFELVNGGFAEVSSEFSVVFGGPGPITGEDFEPIGLQLVWSRASPIGDINGDGINDIATSFAGYKGSVDVLLGGPNVRQRLSLDTAIDGVGRFQLNGSVVPVETLSPAQGDNVGNILRRIGDVNGDGADDLYVGAARDHAGAQAFLVYGQSSVSGFGSVNEVLNLLSNSTVTYTVSDLSLAHAERLRIDLEARQQGIQADPNIRNNSVSIVIDTETDLAEFYAQDMLTLIENYGAAETEETDGDLNGDETVDFGDYLIYSKRFAP